MNYEDGACPMVTVVDLRVLCGSGEKVRPVELEYLRMILSSDASVELWKARMDASMN